jgi:putative transposase
MIDRSHDLSITKQAKVLGISRGSIYYLPRPVPAVDLAIMRRMDELHLEFPFAGSRMLRDLLKQEGIDIGRRHVSALMKRMGIEALYRKPNTSKPAPGHKIYPYLLRGMTIDRPNQVWAMDITDVPISPLTKSARSDSIEGREQIGVRLWQWVGRAIVRAT